MLELHSPWFLLLLPLVALVCVRRNGEPLIRIGRGRTHALLFSSPVPMETLAVTSRSTERAAVLNFLRGLTLALLIVALARPQRATLFAESEASGRDILLVLDVSGSMNALDFSIDGQRVDRLTALKHVAKEFVAERRGDRMGLVIFGTDVFTQCPLTMDVSVLTDLISSLDVGMVGDGTALGDGLVVAVKRLRDIPADSKVIVLVTDGVKTAGSVEPKEAADAAKAEKIKVYTIGIGGNKQAPFRTRGVFGEPRLEYRPVELDEKTLEDVATLTGGKYYNAQKTETLRDVYEQISKLEERVDKSYEYFEYDELYLPFLFGALLCFLLHELLAATRYLQIP